MTAAAVPLRQVDLLATGETFASRERPARRAVAADRAVDLLSRAAVPPEVKVISRDVLQLNSFAMTPVDMQVVLDAVLDSAASPATGGVVVTHRTDTMEETAFLVDLFLSGETPVVFTGAQRSADFADSDGPANLRHAVAVAAAEVTRGIGTVIVFDGLISPARGTRKTHTSARSAFSCPNAGALGGLVGGEPRMFAQPWPIPPLDHAAFRSGRVRVDIIAVYPG